MAIPQEQLQTWTNQGATVVNRTGSQATAQDKHGNIPLHRDENALVAVHLIRHGTDVYVRNRSCHTLLYTSMDAGVAQTLIEQGADVNCKGSSDETPLHVCCEDVVEVLVSLGGDLYAVDENGRTPLICLSSQDNYTNFDPLSTAELFIDAGADVNASDGDETLHCIMLCSTMI